MIHLVERRDPPDPKDGAAVIWMSDGTQNGNRGDVFIKVNVGGTVKKVRIVDYNNL